MQKQRKPYRIIGAYDSETANIYNTFGAVAYPILHQLGTIGIPIEEITSENVKRDTTIRLYRHTFEVCAAFDEIIEQTFDYVPVICCHNLSFDMYPLADWLKSYDVRVLAKSRQKPITFTIKDDKGNPRLVIWDTLVFSGRGLEAMGRECGFEKLVGSWDYNLIRTPETPLADNEIAYAQHDIYALLAWLGYWCRKNPDIEPRKLGLNVVTKTGVVRERRRIRFDQLQGNGAKYNIGRFWMYLNRTEQPKTDDELFTMHACTRGGFTFCASSSAAKPYMLENSDYVIAGYDAISMHPSIMVGHKYPVGFHATSTKALENMFYLVNETTFDEVLAKWVEPFGVAFNACFRFTNLRLKEGSVFKREGIGTLASARITNSDLALDEDNEQRLLFHSEIREKGYQDKAINPRYAFGKLISADQADLYLTELAAWEMAQCYEWDSVKALSGYCATRFVRPSDMAVASVCEFYVAKNEFKRAMGEYERTGTISNYEALISLGVAQPVASSMKCGAISDGEVKQYYQLIKSNLNALFGIEASNEYRQDTELGESGIEYKPGIGLANAPKNPKTWYQFGQRIVGYSRIAQMCAILLIDGIAMRIVNGDTDSVKILVRKSDLGLVDNALSKLGSAIDRGKEIAMRRFKTCYPAHYDDLRDIGHYELEFESLNFCAAWNKAYCTYDIDPRDGKHHYHFTIAGIPARDGLDKWADMLADQGRTFEEITSYVLGFNQLLAHDLTGLNARSFPEWGSMFADRVTDYQGNSALVAEPHALALYPMDKEINSLANAENRANYEYCKVNNPSINIDDIILTWTKKGLPVVIDVN